MGSRMLQISVVMGVYNAEKYLRDAMDSILSQRYGDFELIVVNDGSTDSSGEILEEYRRVDTRVRLVSNGMNIGLTRSLNIGLQEASGTFIARQDADDTSHPDRLQKQVEILQDQAHLCLVGCISELIDAEGTKFGEIHPVVTESELLKYFARTESPFAHGSVMFRREQILDVGAYDERFWFAQDFDLWIRIMQRYPNGFSFVKEPLYKLRREIPSSSFKALCQRRYAELAWQQYQQGQRIEFGDVRQWVQIRNPNSLEPDTFGMGEYWLYLSLTALHNGYRSLSRKYAIKASTYGSWRIVVRAGWRLVLSLVPRNLVLQIQMRTRLILYPEDHRRPRR